MGMDYLCYSKSWRKKQMDIYVFQVLSILQLLVKNKEEKHDLITILMTLKGARDQANEYQLVAKELMQ